MTQVTYIRQVFPSKLIQARDIIRELPWDQWFFLEVIVSTETANSISCLFFVRNIEEFFVSLRAPFLSEFFDFIFS